MPSADFWIDWRVAGTVEQLRRLLPGLAAAVGCRMVEVQSIATHAGWSQLSLESAGASVGMLRAQDEPDGRAQLLIAPGSARDETSLATLNRAAVAIYCGLVLRGLLAPPPPLEIPAAPIVPPEA